MKEHLIQKINIIYVIDNKAIGYNELEWLGNNVDTFYPSYIIKDKNAAIVDVIIKDNIEVVKTLNSIKWIASEINTFGYTDGDYYININADQTLETKRCEATLGKIVQWTIVGRAFES